MSSSMTAGQTHRLNSLGKCPTVRGPEAHAISSMRMRRRTASMRIKGVPELWRHVPSYRTDGPVVGGSTPHQGGGYIPPP